MVLELKDKLASVDTAGKAAALSGGGPPLNSVDHDVLSALLNLGCARPHAEAAVRKVKARGASAGLSRSSAGACRSALGVFTLSWLSDARQAWFLPEPRPKTVNSKRRCAHDARRFHRATAVRENLSIAIEAAKHAARPWITCCFTGLRAWARPRWRRSSPRNWRCGSPRPAGPVLQKKLDLTGILSNIRARQVFFIDEVHRLLPDVEEMLYSALEDFRWISWWAWVRARGRTRCRCRSSRPSARPRGKGLVSAPLRGRFGLVLRLDPYDVPELKPSCSVRRGC